MALPDRSALALAIDEYVVKQSSKKATHSPVKEADVEARVVANVKRLGGIAYKFTSPARRSVPDRLCILPVADEHKEIVSRYVRFVEAKRPGEVATASQQREHERLRALGFSVLVIDTKQIADTEFSKTTNLFE